MSNQKSDDNAKKRFPTKYHDVQTLDILNAVPGFVYRWCSETFSKSGAPAPDMRGWVPVNHNLGDPESISGFKFGADTDGLVRKGHLILCKATKEWKQDRDEALEKINASKVGVIKQKTIRDLEKLRVSVIDSLDEKKSKLI